MILLKAFYRKKTIKNYFIIITLVFFVIFSLLIIKQFYINKNNDYYKSSFIFLEAKNINTSSIKNKNIKDCFYALKDNYSGAIFVADNNLEKNEIIIPSFSNEDYKVNDEIFIEEYNLKLRIKEFQDRNNFYYIDNETFENLKSSNLTLLYIISLKNYIYKEKTINDLQNNFEECIIYFYNNTNTSLKNYENIIIVITTFLTIIVIIFCILFIITIMNIFIEEKKINELYSVIGYSNFKIFLIFMEKIISLILMPFITSLILTSLIYFILYK